MRLKNAGARLLAFSFWMLASSSSSACIIIGDSIAVGVQKFKPECRTLAKGGINTWQWNQIFNPRNDLLADQLVVISLGTNDHAYIKTKAELIKIRRHIFADRVIWVLPAGNLRASGVSLQDIQESVISVANQYQDGVIQIRHLSGDRIHPSWNGYRDLVGQL